MNKVLRMPGKRDRLVSILKDLAEQVEAGDDISFVFCARDKEGNGISSWYDGEGGLAERQFLVSTLQVEVTMGVMESHMLVDVEEDN